MGDGLTGREQCSEPHLESASILQMNNMGYRISAWGMMLMFYDIVLSWTRQWKALEIVKILN